MAEARQGKCSAGPVAVVVAGATDRVIGAALQQGSGGLEGESELHTVVVEVGGLGAARGAVDSLLCASPSRWRLGAAIGGRSCIISSMRSSTAVAAGAEEYQCNSHVGPCQRGAGRRD